MSLRIGGSTVDTRKQLMVRHAGEFVPEVVARASGSRHLHKPSRRTAEPPRADRRHPWHGPAVGRGTGPRPYGQAARGQARRRPDRECQRRGLTINLVRGQVDQMTACLRIAPPLTVTEDEIDQAIDILDASLTKITASVGKD
jgi:hypothetical protein